MDHRAAATVFGRYLGLPDIVIDCAVVGSEWAETHLRLPLIEDTLDRFAAMQAHDRSAPGSIPVLQSLRSEEN
jgi:hypothetical protein